MGNGKDQSEWWQTFFYGPWQDLQLSDTPGEQTRADAEFIVSALHLRPGAEILDIPCGAGRHSIEFAKSGYRPTGIDFNPNAIKRAQERATEAGVTADFLVSDMREFSATQSFDGAVCFSGSFGYFDDDQSLRFASRVAQALRPGGRFLIDLHVAESIFPKFSNRDWRWAQDDPPLRILEERRWDLVSGKIEATWSFLGETLVSCPVSMRIYTYRELCDLLRSAGFSEFEALVTGKDEPFQLGSTRLSIVAGK